MPDIAIVVALTIIALVVGAVVLDQRRVRKARSSLRKDLETGQYVWTDLDGTTHRSDVHPGKRHTDSETGGAWGDGAGPDLDS